MESKWEKLLVVIPSIAVDSFFDIETLSAGTNMTLSYLIQHLTKYADLHFASSRNKKITDRVYEVDIGIDDLVCLRSKIAETYYGILTLHLEHEEWLLRLYRLKDHTTREAEAILAALVTNEAEAKAILKNIHGRMLRRNLSKCLRRVANKKLTIVGQKAHYSHRFSVIGMNPIQAF